MMISLSILMGMFIFSLVPFILQLFFIPLTFFNIFLVIFIIAILLTLAKNRWKEIPGLWSIKRIKIRLYEWPALGLISFILLVSLWRSFYLPPTPRDLTSGPEVIAEYTVKEKTMINSVFTVDLSTTNNQFKSPYITSLQVIYKYAGFKFGQVWLGILVICFFVFLYHSLSLHIQRFITGILLIFFLAIPEMYAYTFMALFDYPNAVYFFLSCWFLFEFFRNGEKNNILLSGLLMGIATWIRSETLVFGCLLSFSIMWYHIKRWDSFTSLARSCLRFLLPSFIFYLIPVVVYLKLYLPGSYEVSQLINDNLLNPLPLLERFVEMNFALIFSSQGILYYGYFIFIFLLLLVLDLVFNEKMNRNARNWLYAILVIYLGYPLLGFVLPLLDIEHSTKRGFFKLFPLMLLYLANSNLLKYISGSLDQWEEKKEVILNP